MVRDEVLSRLVGTALGPAPRGTRAALRLLVGDFVACAASGAGSDDVGSGSGMTDLAADLARWASAQDLDDVDWGCVTHPGSVVQPAVLAAASQSGAPGDIAMAMSVGYRVTGDLALVLGPQYRPVWHATAICGVVGAAAAASMVLDPAGASLETAMALACLVAGGRSQAVVARNGAAAFNRQAAAASAVLAARAAHRGDQAVQAPFTGKGGLVEALALESVALDARRHNGPVETSLRLFPVTGFAHGAVLAASRLAEEAGPKVTGLRVQVAAAAIGMSLPDTSGWWDSATAVARAFGHGDPFACATALPGVDTAVVMEEDDLDVGAATIIAVSEDGNTVDRHEPAPGGVRLAETEALWRRKCERVLRCDPDQALHLADRLLDGDVPLGSALPREVESLSHGG